MVRPKFVEKAVNSLANSASGLYNKVSLWLSKGTPFDNSYFKVKGGKTKWRIMQSVQQI